MLSNLMVSSVSSQAFKMLMSGEARMQDQDNDITPMGYLCFSVIDEFLFNLNIKSGTACKRILYFGQ